MEAGDGKWERLTSMSYNNFKNSVSGVSLSALRNPDGISYHLEKLKPTINKIQANQVKICIVFKC